MKKLLIGYDGSDPAKAATRMAANLARHLGATLTVFTLGQSAPIPAGLGGMFIPLVDEKDFLPVAEEGGEIARALGVEPEIRVGLGDPAAKIIEVAESEGYDLVVVGHRGIGGVRELVLGSVAKTLAEASPCPVIVVQGTVPDTVRRILVAVDGSEQAKRALSAAAHLALPLAAHLTLLHVLDSTILAAIPRREAKRELRLTLKKVARDALMEAIQVCQQVGVDYDAVETEGRPAQIICRRAKRGDYDLVAIGRHGMSGLARLALGSVSDVVLRNAGRPVLLAGERVKEERARS